jgi:hypothetical protein
VKNTDRGITKGSMYAPTTAQNGIAYPMNPSKNIVAMNTRIAPVPTNSDFKIFFLSPLSRRTVADPRITKSK